MSSVFKTVKWRKNALNLIDHATQLDANLPAIMHIRHSERYPVNPQQEASELALTARGQQIAYEFGKKLPQNRRYLLYYTNVERTQQTALNILKGIHNNKGTANIVETIPATTIANREEYNRIMKERVIDFLDLETEEELTRSYINQWLSGFYPPNAMNPSIELAKKLANYGIKKIREANSNCLHIFVSHDLWVAALFLHWLGEVSYDYVSFMDGFIVQFYEDYAMSYFRGKKKKVIYPYWWT